jgi:hypothetical protein
VNGVRSGDCTQTGLSAVQEDTAVNFKCDFCSKNVKRDFYAESFRHLTREKSVCIFLYHYFFSIDLLCSRHVCMLLSCTRILFDVTCASLFLHTDHFLIYGAFICSLF